MKIVGELDNYLYVTIPRKEYPLLNKHPKEVTFIDEECFEFVKTWMELYPVARYPDDPDYYEDNKHDKLVSLISKVYNKFDHNDISNSLTALGF